MPVSSIPSRFRYGLLCSLALNGPLGVIEVGRGMKGKLWFLTLLLRHREQE
jgi:hypothetical protein